jgi:hypothetical protein
MAQEEARSSAGPAQKAARAVADGVYETADRAATAIRQASDGVTEFRAVIRKQPITMAFLMLGMGYLLGSHLRPGRE